VRVAGTAFEVRGNAVRIALALIVAAACTDPETPADRLHDLIAKTTVACGSFHQEATTCGMWSAPPEQVAACMNDALATGAHAQMTETSPDRESPR
jgi:hypothetical protein